MGLPSSGKQLHSTPSHEKGLGQRLLTRGRGVVGDDDVVAPRVLRKVNDNVDALRHRDQNVVHHNGRREEAPVCPNLHWPQGDHKDGCMMVLKEYRLPQYYQEFLPHCHGTCMYTSTVLPRVLLHVTVAHSRSVAVPAHWHGTTKSTVTCGGGPLTRWNLRAGPLMGSWKEG